MSLPRSSKRMQRIAFLLSAVLLTVLSGACSGSSKSNATVHSPDKRLSDAEYQFGASVKRVKGVTFQPDVVIPGGGANSVRSVSADGMTWTLDPHASGVGDLKPGKLLMVTNRGCGRVLKVEKTSQGVAVTIGPAALTDYIKDIKTKYNGPLDTKAVQFRMGTGVPGMVTDLDSGPGARHPKKTSGSVPPTTVAYRPTPSTKHNTIVGASFANGASDLFGRSKSLLTGGVGQIPGGVLPPPTPGVPSVPPIRGMKMYPLWGSDGIGIEVAYNKNGVVLKGDAKVYLDRPQIKFDLNITNGKIVTALVQLTGAGGVHIAFDAGSKVGLNGNIHEIATLPLDISIPIFGPGLPFAATFQNTFLVETAFSAKNSTLHLEGDYGFGGSIGAGYFDGHFGVYPLNGFTVRKSLLQTTNGISIGVNGIVLSHKLRVIVGIGGFGFAVGPYASLISSVGVTNGSDLGIVKCKGATFDMKLGYGIGYQIPQAVTAVINFFLRALNIKQIAPSGGTPPQLKSLLHRSGVVPKLKICDGAA